MNLLSHSRTIRFAIYACLLHLVAVDAMGEETVADDRPNFLVILLDDAGWTDIGCFGSRINTPNIDRLADQGMRFTDCHSAAPNCSPSRAGLLTGRTPARLGIYSYLPTGHVMHLRDEEVTVAELLKQKGYRTGHFGKWHLSRLESDQPGPKQQGFDYSLGTDNNAKPSHLNPVNFVRNGKPVGEVKGYSCQIVVDETIGWLERNQHEAADDPFFACVWFHEPHTPIASPPDLIDYYQEHAPELTKKQATYLANIHNVDLAVGRLLKRLDELKLADDTLIYFTSDNGPLNRFSRVGLRGQKSNLWEGGHRVPGIFRWPGRIPAGKKCETPISGVDFLPTVCEIVGIDPSKNQQLQNRHLDGQSILPLLEGDFPSFKRQQPLYWFFYRLNPSIAIRDGNWSLVSHTNDKDRPKAHPLVREDMPKIKASKPIDYQLFNVDNDLGQQHEISEHHRDMFHRLRSSMEQIHASVIDEGHEWDIPVDYASKNKRKVWNSSD